MLPKNPSGAATTTEEQQLVPLTGLPATQVTDDTAPKGPTGRHAENPEILPDTVTTPQGDITELSQDFTLSEEGEGDNIKGNKELRKEGDDEDENNSKVRCRTVQYCSQIFRYGTVRYRSRHYSLFIVRYRTIRC